jgi:gamma-glutamylcyclotransferase (GGCT)/AIG2-like uncharacterized protein YtfP
MPLIFSYGSLREERVQLSTFGRRLEGWADAVVGYERSSVINDDPETIAFSGTREHANLVPTESGARVEGMVFEITDAELVRVDEYERRFSYERIDVALASGGRAWVYVFSTIHR